MPASKCSAINDGRLLVGVCGSKPVGRSLWVCFLLDLVPNGLLKPPKGLTSALGAMKSFYGIIS